MRIGFALSWGVAAIVLTGLLAADAGAQSERSQPAPNVTSPQPKMPGAAPVPRQLDPPAAEEELEGGNAAPFQGCPDAGRKLELVV
jgi:hypothetical protein